MWYTYTPAHNTLRHITFKMKSIKIYLVYNREWVLDEEGKQMEREMERRKEQHERLDLYRCDWTQASNHRKNNVIGLSRG